jgi:hypothetical protein
MLDSLHDFLYIIQPVVAESYEEVVFADPTSAFHAQLLRYGSHPAAAGRQPTALREHYTLFDASLDLEALRLVHLHLQSELAGRG